MVKDHVKSAKGAKDAVFIGDSGDKREVWNVVNNMIKERGPLFERGIVFKKRVEIKKDAEGKPIEARLFFFNGRAFSVHENDCTYSALFALEEHRKDIASEMGNGFYTVDAALCEDGSWKVLECGDGQVSGLTPSMDPVKFYRSLKISVANMEPEELDEHPLSDDYPVYWDYFYVVDGKVIRSDIKGTVLQLKQELRKRGMEANDVTSCDIIGRTKETA